MQITKWPLASAAVAALALLGASAVGAADAPASAIPQVGKPFSDCPDKHCPQMVVVPASPQGLLLGSPPNEEGRLESEKQHAVAIKSFAIGVDEVKTGEYMACVADKGCRPPEWLEPGGEHNIETGNGVTYKSMVKYIKGDEQPIVGVSWDDANAYATWLSKTSGQRYRLPSEEEWEYAARAGSSTMFWWGNDVKLKDESMACCRGCGSDLDGVGLYAAQSFKPNAFGLHNTLGNVWEWVEDYYCDTYETSPADGTARHSKSCGKPGGIEGLRVFRGGSCFYEPRQMRAAMRLRNWPAFRNQTLGFRVARDVQP